MFRWPLGMGYGAWPEVRLGAFERGQCGASNEALAGARAGYSGGNDERAAGAWSSCGGG